MDFMDILMRVVEQQGVVALMLVYVIYMQKKLMNGMQARLDRMTDFIQCSLTDSISHGRSDHISSIPLCDRYKTEDLSTGDMISPYE